MSTSFHIYSTSVFLDTSAFTETMNSKYHSSFIPEAPQHQTSVPATTITETMNPNYHSSFIPEAPKHQTSVPLTPTVEAESSSSAVYASKKTLSPDQYELKYGSSIGSNVLPSQVIQFPLSSNTYRANQQFAIPIIYSFLPPLFQPEDSNYKPSVNISYRPAHQIDYRTRTSFKQNSWPCSQRNGTPYVKLHKRMNFTPQQKTLLLERFEASDSIEKDEREYLADKIGIPEHVIKTFFQNERARRRRAKRIADDIKQAAGINQAPDEQVYQV